MNSAWSGVFSVLPFVGGAGFLCFSLGNGLATIKFSMYPMHIIFLVFEHIQQGLA